MLDLTFIREHPDVVKDALVKLNADAPIDKILELDRQRRDRLQEVEALRAERNAGSKQVGGLMREGRRDEAEALKQRMSQIADRIARLDEQLRQVESPYNTYLHRGLPPGPICSPGLASIQAVLQPAKTDYLYYYAKGDGSHAFARTFEEHLENQQKYHQ